MQSCTNNAAEDLLTFSTRRIEFTVTNVNKLISDAKKFFFVAVVSRRLGDDEIVCCTLWRYEFYHIIATS